MSAISKMNGSRTSVAPSLIGYGELRDKVAALVRPERVATNTVSAIQPRPVVETVASQAAVKPDRREAGIEDLGSAFDILGRATSCFDLLAQKLEQVGSERDEALAQVEDHKRAASSWQEMIETIQARMRDAEQDLVKMGQEIAAQTKRADMAEQRAAELEDTLRNKDRRLGELEKTYTSLHNQVVSSFGFESPTYRALEVLVDRFQSRAA